MRLLLFSNSTNAGEEYLSYTLPHIKNFLISKPQNALFIPYAGISVGFDKYIEMVRKAFKPIALNITSIHNKPHLKQAVAKADCIIIGGGNTFCLLKTLQEFDLSESIRQKVKSGTPYIGWSAGSNIACPTICTTNDMPIVQPRNFSALNLIPFQINPHYTDLKQKDHAGETREMRINEYLIENPGMFVTGLREGTLFRIEDRKIELKGDKKCRIFRKGDKILEKRSGNDFSFLMQ